MRIVSSILKTKTFRHSSITITGTLVNGVLGMLFYIFVARELGPESFGLFAVSIAAITLLSDIGSIGTDTGLVRFVGKYALSDQDKAFRFLKLGLLVKIFAWIAILIVGFLITPFLASSVFQKKELIFPLRLSLVGAGGALLFSFTSSALQAYQYFFSWSTLNVSLNLLRLLLVVILSSVGILTAYSGIAAYLIFPFLGFLVGLAVIPKFLKVKDEWLVSREFFKYNKWVALFILIAAFSSRLDVFLTTSFLSLSQVGVYSVATSTVSIVPQIIFAIAAVAAPKLSTFDSDKKAYLYLRKLQLMVLVLGVFGFVGGSLAGYFFIPFLYGVEYTGSIIPFIILLLANAFFLVSVPAHTAIFYYFSKPKIFVYIALINLLIVGVSSLFLIGSLGAMGAALAVLIGNIFNFVIPFIWVMINFK